MNSSKATIQDIAGVTYAKRTGAIYMKCQCRNCGKEYPEHKSRADYKGYCSAKCLHDKAKKLGFRKTRHGRGHYEYDTLKNANEIGSVYI